MMNLPIAIINYPFDKELLKKIYISVKNQKIEYNDITHGVIPNFSIIKLNECSYIDQVKKDLKIPTAKPRFYTLEANSLLPEHIDLTTMCSINVLLSDSQNAPVVIEDTEFFYDQCLLNTQKRHYVKNGNDERLLFKLSIFDMTFNDVYRKIKNYIL